MKQPPTQEQQPKSPKTSWLKPWMKYTLITLVVLLAFGSYRYYQTQQQFQKRMQVAQRQRDVLTESLKNQGLTDEQIQEKLRETRQFNGEYQRPNSLTRMFRRLTGGSRPSGRDSNFNPGNRPNRQP